jgi:hypothetical protein
MVILIKKFVTDMVGGSGKDAGKKRGCKENYSIFPLAPEKNP